MREIVFDTETTGFKPEDGHRIVEIGAVELINMLPTGREFHVYVNPEREVPQPAFQVHGLNQAFLSKHPVFRVHAQAMLEFFGNSPLIAHNASFDLRFLNYELKILGLPELSNPIIDTLSIARTKFPGSPASLDALTKRFNISGYSRDKHGALLDSQILADVYLQLKGGRQSSFLNTEKQHEDHTATINTLQPQFAPRRDARPFPASKQEERDHAEMCAQIEATGTPPVWHN